MKSGLTKLILIATVSAGALFLAGCTSTDQKPYSLTGEQDTTSPWSDPRNLDSKGHYHPEWQAAQTRGHQ